MESDLQFTLICVVIILAVISPGPDFAVTVRNSLRSGRRSGLATAVGIASGVSVHIAYSLAGLSYLMADAVWLLEFMRYLGAAYLVWLGVSAFLPRTVKDMNIAAELSKNTPSDWQAFRNGFICNALNPKTALFFVALFTQIIDPNTAVTVQAGFGLFIAVTHLVWFSIVAILLTHARFKMIFEQSKNIIERVVGVCLVGLGAKLAIGP